MEGKINEMTEAFEREDFVTASRIAEQLESKPSKAEKKKKSYELDAEKIMQVKLIQAASYSCLGKIHLSDLITNKYFYSEETLRSLAVDKIGILGTIGDFSLSDTIQRIFPIILSFITTKDIKLHAYYLASKLYRELGKVYFHEYMQSKDIEMFYGNLLLTYVESASQLKVSRPTKNSVIQQLDPKGFTMLKAFIAKFQGELTNRIKDCEAEKEKIEKQEQIYLEEKARLELKGEANKEKQEEPTKEVATETLQKPKKNKKKKEVKQSDKNEKNQEKGEEISELQQKLKGNSLCLDRIAYKKANWVKLQRIETDLIKLQIRLAIHEDKMEDATRLLQSNRNRISHPFKYLTSLKRQCFDFYLTEMSIIFRRNLDFATYTPLYDYYNQFLSAILEKQGNVEVIAHMNTPESVPEEEFKQDSWYVFSDKSNLIATYCKSLLCQYRAVKREVKKSDYYYICLKGLLLQLLAIHSKTKATSLTFFLKEYVSLFGGTLSFAKEMKPYWEPLFKQGIVTPEHEPHFTHIQLALEPTKQVVGDVIDSLLKKYNQEDKSVNKIAVGERFSSDQYLVILSDYLRLYLARHPEDLMRHIQIIDVIESALKVSPYNVDLKLRLMHFSSSLNHFETVFRVFGGMDIKSVQFDTLSYWVICPMLANCLMNEQHQELMKKMVKSYQSNERESASYASKALKASDLEQMEELLAYKEHIHHSYSKLMMFFMQYFTFRFHQNSSFYLLEIKKIIETGRVTFNCDYSVMQNQLDRGSTFGEFYGVYNSSKLLHAEVSIRLNEDALMAKLLKKQSRVQMEPIEKLLEYEQTIMGITLQELFDFHCYTYYDKELTTTDIPSHLAPSLLMYQKSIGLKCAAMRVASGGDPNMVTLKLKEIHQCYQELKWRDQVKTVLMLRRGLFQSNALLNLLENGKQCAEACLELVMEINPKQHTDIYRSPNDDILERMTKISKNQVNSIKSKYQKAYRPQ